MGPNTFNISSDNNFLISQNIFAEIKVPKEHIICIMNYLPGEDFGLPHGTTPSAVERAF